MPYLNLTSFELQLLNPVRRWLESIEVHNAKVAQLLCKMIPGRCPFEQEIKFFDYTIFLIPHGSLREG